MLPAIQDTANSRYRGRPNVNVRSTSNLQTFDRDGYTVIPGFFTADEVAVTVGPGDLTVHHCLTIHRAGANRSARPRRAMGGIYYSTRAKLDQRAQDEYLRNLGELMQEKSS